MNTSETEELKSGIGCLVFMCIGFFVMVSCVKHVNKEEKLARETKIQEFRQSFGTHGKVVDIYSYYGNDKFHTPRTTAVLENGEGKRIKVVINDLIPLKGETWYVEHDGSMWNSPKLTKRKE